MVVIKFLLDAAVAVLAFERLGTTINLYREPTFGTVLILNTKEVIRFEVQLVSEWDSERVAFLGEDLTSGNVLEAKSVAPPAL